MFKWLRRLLGHRVDDDHLQTQAVDAVARLEGDLKELRESDDPLRALVHNAQQIRLMQRLREP